MDRISSNIAHLSMQTRKTRRICRCNRRICRDRQRPPRPRHSTPAALQGSPRAQAPPATPTLWRRQCIRVHAVEGGRVGMEPEGHERRRIHLLHFPLLLPPRITKSLQLGAGLRAHQGRRRLAHATRRYLSLQLSKWLWPRCCSLVRLRAPLQF